MRSYMERRLTMASTPIIRYYDHLRFVYEVETRMRELRRSNQGEGQGGDNKTQQPQKDAAPGESKQSPVHKDGTRVDPPQQSVSPALNDTNDLLEASLTSQGTSRAFRRLQTGTTGTALRERSTVWTA
jgi:hypothetical protein